MSGTSSSKGIALVTGAGQGIGREIALRLADDGFDVAINDIVSNSTNLATVADEIKGKGRRALTVAADVSSDEQVKNMIASTVAELGGLDVMVANAGILKWEALVETSVEDWDRLFSVNVRGVFLCYKYAAIQMIAQGRGGRIIGAASIAGKRGGRFLSGYSSTKFAVRGLTQSAALEFAPHGITVNAYAPGAIVTPMLDYMATSSLETGASPGDFSKRMDTMAALGHKGSPTDVANLVSFLASKESSFITGQSISTDGGSYFD